MGQEVTTRRRFLQGSAVAGAWLATPGLARAAITASAPARKRVAVFGGGMGGLAVAHELAERGYAVTVYEPKALGGKARSIPVPATGTGGRADLPGEHGFRFFPGFYESVPDTMSRIPFAGNANGVLGNLVGATQELLIVDGNQEIWAPPTLNASAGILQLMETVVSALGVAAQIPLNEIEYAVRKLGVFLTSCDARRVGEWEYVGWYQFTNAAAFSSEYQNVVGSGITKDLVAAKGTLASTRTVGLMAEAFIYALLGQYVPAIQKQSGYGNADRLLNAPTNEAWIDPWVAYLVSLGVQFVSGYGAVKLQLQGGQIVGAVVADAGGNQQAVVADWYVAAMPVEKAVPLFDSAVLAAAPELASLSRLTTDFMNGIQFFLRRPPGEQVHGHVALLDSPWSLTSIDQGLFWNRNIASRYGDGTVVDVLSIDISDFNTPGILYGKPAVDCTPQQITAEVWAQLKAGFNAKGRTVLTDDMVVTSFLDPAVTYPVAGGPAVSTEPLLINTAGSLDWRPNATTSIPNLFLAADYVRTNIDLATMEGANQAGRQAANAILAASGSSATPAKLGKLWQPAALSSALQTDALRYKAGLPNALDTIPSWIPL
jgi:uncharacterized protein with NAD-binding domain and iron-sulfur cluster